MRVLGRRCSRSPPYDEARSSGGEGAPRTNEISSTIDASGKLFDTVASPCSDQKDFAVAKGPLNDRETTFELLSSMGTCLPSEDRITVSKAK